MCMKNIIIVVAFGMLINMCFADVPVQEGLIIHLDAQSISGLSDGDIVSTWTDSSSSDAVVGDVFSVSGWNTPVYVSNALNGHPAIRMNGSHALVSNSISIPSVDSGLTVIVVATGDGSGDAGERLLQFGQLNSNTGHIIGMDYSTNTTLSDGGSGLRFNNGKMLVKDGNPVTKSFHIVAAQIGQGQTYSAAKYYVDNLQLQEFNNTASNNNIFTLIADNNKLSIGTGYSNGTPGALMTSDAYEGDISEIIIYNKQLDLTEMEQVYDYLYGKYFDESLIIHLNAAELSGLDSGDSVTEWLDLTDSDTVSGDVFSVAGINAPVYKPFALNGNPAVSFSGSDVLAGSLFSIPNIDNGLTVIAVASGDQSGESAERMMQIGQKQDNAGHIVGVDLSTNSTDSNGGSGCRFNNGKSLVKTSNPVSTGFHIVALQIGQGNTYDSLKYYVDTLDQQAFDNTAGETNIFELMSNNNILTIGNGLSSSGTYYATDLYQGEIAEIMVYNSQLSYNQLQVIFDRLQEQYFSPLVVISPNEMELEEGQTATVQVSLDFQPASNVSVSLQDQSIPSEVTFVPGILEFSTENWNQPQAVQIASVDNILLQSESYYPKLTATASSTDPAYDGYTASVDVTVIEDECGRWVNLPGDFNEDCEVNITDFAILAKFWLWCDPMKSDTCMDLQ